MCRAGKAVLRGFDMARTIEEIIALLEADVLELPRENEYDEGFAAGVMQAIFLLKQVKKEAEK